MLLVWQKESGVSRSSLSELAYPGANRPEIVHWTIRTMQASETTNVGTAERNGGLASAFTDHEK